MRLTKPATASMARPSQLISVLDRQRAKSMPVGAKRHLALVAVLMLATTTPAYANSGVPMVGLYLPPAWLLLAPIIVLEALHGTLRSGVPFRRALLAQSLANGLSTLVGLPFCWMLLATGQLLCCRKALGLQTGPQNVYAVTIQAPWLIPYEQDLWWMVPAAATVLTSVFWVMSILSEYPIIKRIVPSLDPRALWRWVIASNTISYGLVCVVVVAVSANDSLATRMNMAFSVVTGPMIGVVFEMVKSMLGVK